MDFETKKSSHAVTMCKCCLDQQLKSDMAQILSYVCVCVWLYVKLLVPPIRLNIIDSKARPVAHDEVIFCVQLKLFFYFIYLFNLFCWRASLNVESWYIQWIFFLVFNLSAFIFCIFYWVLSNGWTPCCGHLVFRWHLQNLFLAIVHIIRSLYVGWSHKACI